MKCSDAIKNNLCLGCNRCEIEDGNADDCKYRDRGYEAAKKVIEGIQQKFN